MSPLKIVITGPESTGKSVLTAALARHFNGAMLDEFAREYISSLSRPYNISDVELIGRRQIADLKKAVTETSRPVIFVDTFLIITKVWFEVVFNTSPRWMEEALLSSGVDLFLLCAPDIPWIKDNVRENGGEMREWLFQEYENNIIKYNFAYKIVQGAGEARTQNAIAQVESFLAQNSLSL
jgi:nicotinamide riboside kinase